MLRPRREVSARFRPPARFVADFCRLLVAFGKPLISSLCSTSKAEQSICQGKQGIDSVPAINLREAVDASQGSLSIAVTYPWAGVSGKFILRYTRVRDRFGPS
jgi:hypothetical protein